jgi:hypothetical protein
MIAYLTFVRKNDKDIHLIGLKNPSNIQILNDLDLVSAQPIVCILENDLITSFYLLNVNGDMLQVKGARDYLFDLNEIYDLTFLNIKKYNIIKYYLLSIFHQLSIEESKIFADDFHILENKIFYDLLHTEQENQQIKSHIIKLINKSSLNDQIKKRLAFYLKRTKIASRNILRKKIDINLLDYSINIYSLIL